VSEPSGAREQRATSDRRLALDRRRRRIRQSVAGLAVTLFAVAFSIVYVRLASGHDPVLSAATRHRAADVRRVDARHAASGPSTSPSTSGEEPASSGEAAQQTQSEASGGSSSGGSPVSTGQS
jgi:hypothetical protein